MLRLIILLCLILSTPAVAKPEDLDRTFAGTGRAAFAPGVGGSYATDVATDGSGGLVLAGASVREHALYRLAVTIGRLNRAGRPDDGFGTAGWASFDADPSRRY